MSFNISKCKVMHLGRRIPILHEWPVVGRSHISYKDFGIVMTMQSLESP